MKKYAVIGILTLVIITSMVAGTLAVYTKDFEFNGTVSAKMFFVDASSDAASPEITLAPGETQDWTFQVTNADSNSNIISGVDMNTKILVDIPSGFEDIKVTLKQGDTELASGTAANGKIELNGADFIAGTAKVDTYQLSFTWVEENTDNDRTDTALGISGASSPFRVTVTGSQKLN